MKVSTAGRVTKAKKLHWMLRLLSPLPVAAVSTAWYVNAGESNNRSNAKIQFKSLADIPKHARKVKSQSHG